MWRITIENQTQEFENQQAMIDWMWETHGELWSSYSFSMEEQIDGVWQLPSQPTKFRSS